MESFESGRNSHVQNFGNDNQQGRHDSHVGSLIHPTSTLSAVSSDIMIEFATICDKRLHMATSDCTDTLSMLRMLTIRLHSDEDDEVTP